ncbi:MAG: hypothetical protein HY795_08740 [Desulfovibrio sp.]|nr:hypothetical protein [Desulfovibrio sp.]MBI4958904.1 hypothetical protein [Desulfovibrio sp.]
MTSQWEKLGKVLKDKAPELASAFCSQDTRQGEAAAEILNMILAGKVSLVELPAMIEEGEVVAAVKAANTIFKKYILAQEKKSVIDIYGPEITTKTNRNLVIIASIITISFAIIFILILTKGFGQLDKDTFSNNGPLGMLIGALISAFTTVVQYFFGSSASGNQKDAMLWTSSPPK